jgi:hypothetical protein
MQKFMLKLVLSSLILLFLSCNSTQNTMDNSSEQAPKCPADVECYAELISNKTLVLKEDTIGKLYVNLIDKEGTHVVKYYYVKKSQPEIADSGYAEVVFFEIDDEETSMELKANDLKQAKLIVQKSCFCPEAGYEMITNGHLIVNKSNKTYDISLTFSSSKELKLNALNFSVAK